MTRFITESLPWIPPLPVFLALARKEKCFAFLYSGQQLDYTGRYSYLALYPQDTVHGNRFSLLAKKLGSGDPAPHNAWFGYLGYELLHDVEEMHAEPGLYIDLPHVWFAKFGLVIVFDHEEETVTAHRASRVKLPKWPPAAPDMPVSPSVATLMSPMSRKKYLDIVTKTKEAIKKGDFYQANITRKFTGKFSATPDLFALFCRLTEASPSAYSAFIRTPEAAILSSSPERFLKIEKSGYMEARPIKGTSPRFSSKELDEDSKIYLKTSEKEKAENLMIVDLMRNDLSRSCEAGSIKVERLFEVSSYATLHHMASTVIGQKRENVTTLQAVKDCFPPGSMTGAPKVHAIKWCMDHEHIQRGVYSGALGWFGGDGSCDLSVVIRTLIVKDKKFEFQVGGAITADSDAEKEWQETMTKARGIMAALGLNLRALEEI